MKKMRLCLSNYPMLDPKEYGECGIPSQYLGLRTGDTVKLTYPNGASEFECPIVVYQRDSEENNIFINGFGLTNNIDDLYKRGYSVTPMRKFEEIPAGTVIDNDVEYYEED